MYACGPTVQAAPHVGHGRQAVVFDVIRSHLEWRGYRVKYVANVTDIEDKIIEAAAEEGISTEEVAARATAEFFRAHELLGVRPPDGLCYATEHIPQMIDLIGRLIERGNAYAAGGDVYFSVRSFEGYGKLSGRDPDELQAGARIEPGAHKRDPADFALWKASKPGEPSWDSPWGPGRPGWHIECSAMAEEQLGFGFDIHGGGLDLVFPHHENEIAQAEAAAGAAPFARYWLHNGMVNLGGEKMAKSTGNVVGLLDVLEEHSPLAVRLYYLRAHYRAPMEFSEDLIEDAEASLGRLWAFRRRVGDVDVEPDPEVVERFREAMDDDFKTPEALAVLFEAVRRGNRLLDEGGDASAIAAAFDTVVAILGLTEPAAGVDDLGEEFAALAGEVGAVSGEPMATLEALIERRARARAEGEWELADAIRERLGGLGIVLEDGADGTSWHRD